MGLMSTNWPPLSNIGDCPKCGGRVTGVRGNWTKTDHVRMTSKKMTNPLDRCEKCKSTPPSYAFHGKTKRD